MDNVQTAAHKFSIDQWWHGAQQQPKLRTYIEVRPQDEPTAVVKCNLKRCPRSLLSRLLCGILPLELKVGRFNDMPEELRLCKTCNLPNIENEYHFLFDCAPLQSIRSAFYIENNINIEQFMTVPDAEKVKSLLIEE